MLISMFPRLLPHLFLFISNLVLKESCSLIQNCVEALLFQQCIYMTILSSFFFFFFGTKVFLVFIHSELTRTFVNYNKKEKGETLCYVNGVQVLCSNLIHSSIYVNTFYKFGIYNAPNNHCFFDLKKWKYL